MMWFTNQIQVRSDDIIVINTCGFIDNAKQESIDTILQYSELKDQGKVGKVIVTGCLSERYKPELEAEITNVDAYLALTTFKTSCQYRRRLPPRINWRTPA
jgi:ribosomal protein S12 methylthiotransferase